MKEDMILWEDVTKEPDVVCWVPEASEERTVELSFEDWVGVNSEKSGIEEHAQGPRGAGGRELGSFKN